MIRLPDSVRAWGTPDFEAVAKREIAALDPAALPLQQALSVSSHVAEAPIQATVLASGDQNGRIRVKAGIFYSGIIAGCSCADDPTPMSEQAEYCVLQLDIDPATAEATLTLLPA
ncbi:MAG: hypothetical protein ACLGG6_05335 [Gammaproteobacteria bacterium]